MFYAFTWLGDLIAYRLLGLAPDGRLGSAVQFFVEDTVKIFVLLAVIIFVMGLFRSALSPEKVRRYLEGRPRGATYILAVLLGAITPFCSCSSVPLFIGFLEAGIPLGATLAFLIASPMINEVAVVILGTIIGWKLTALYVGIGLAVGILGGWLTDQLRLDRYVEDYVWKIRIGQASLPEADLSLRGRVAFAAASVTEIVSRVWLYILIGIGAGAFLHGFVPEDFFARYAGAGNPFAVPLAVLAGIPLYSNATGMIPVAEALLAKQVPVGTVLVLMMSVVAISVPEFVILRKVIKLQGLIWFGLYLAVAFVGVGYLFNALIR